MFKYLYSLFLNIVLRIFYGKDPLAAKIPKEVNTEDILLLCWGCYQPLRKEEWGTFDEIMKSIFQPEGHFTAETFCPACQEKLKNIKKYKWGYLAEDVIAKLRNSSNYS